MVVTEPVAYARKLRRPITSYVRADPLTKSCLTPRDTPGFCSALRACSGLVQMAANRPRPSATRSIRGRGRAMLLRARGSPAAPRAARGDPESLAQPSSRAVMRYGDHVKQAAYGREPPGDRSRRR